MYQAPKLSAANPTEFYAELAQQLEGLLFGERNWLANSANFAALLWDRLNLRRLNRYAGIFEKVGGAVLVVVGVMMLTGAFSGLSYWLLDTFPVLGRIG